MLLANQVLQGLTVEADYGHRFQRQLGDLIRSVKPEIVVETGVSEGCSTAFILRAMDDNGKGILYSVDCNPQIDLQHPRWRFYGGMSQDVLPHLATKFGPWDMFLHDSDHGFDCQTFEFELAFKNVKPGGWIVSDDITWGAHGAWDRFLKHHGLTGTKMGHAGLVQI